MKLRFQIYLSKLNSYFFQTFAWKTVNISMYTFLTIHKKMYGLKNSKNKIESFMYGLYSYVYFF